MRREIVVVFMIVLLSMYTAPGYAFYEADYYGTYLLESSKKKISMDLEDASLCAIQVSCFT